MKADTAILVLKAFCFMVIGGATPLTTNLAQWANSGEWPSRINWVVIIGGCVVGGATQLLSFLSQSYGDYLAGRNGAPKPQPPADAGTTKDKP